MISKKWIVIILVLIILISIGGIYFFIFRPGESMEALKAELAQAQKKTELLQEENNIKIDRIAELSGQLRDLEAKYKAERRSRLDAVEEKYISIDPGGTVDILNAITDRARNRRLETVQSRGDPD